MISDTKTVARLTFRALKSGETEIRIATDRLGSVPCGLEERLTLTLEAETPHAHRYEAVVTAPTCTEPGYTTYTCSCGDSYVADETAALGHDWKGTACARCDATRVNPFVDVPEDSWFINPVLWVVEKGVTSGTTATIFSPDASCTRAQVVTFLYAASET